jgi:hypothetical protein
MIELLSKVDLGDQAEWIANTVFIESRKIWFLSLCNCLKMAILLNDPIQRGLSAIAGLDNESHYTVEQSDRVLDGEVREFLPAPIK